MLEFGPKQLKVHALSIHVRHQATGRVESEKTKHEKWKREEEKKNKK